MKRIDRLPAPNLEVRDLRLLIALSEAGTTKAAGETLHLAQPSVSRALLALEERFGEALFHRTPKGLLPTPACERLVAGGEALLANLCALERDARQESVVAPRIRLVSECHTAYHWLPSALQTMRLDMPGVELSLRLECTRDPLASLESKQVDAALVTSPTQPSLEIDVRPLFNDEMVFVVANDHSLAAKKRLTVDDLRAHPLYCAPATAAERRWFASTIFGRAQPRLNVSWVPLTEAIVELTRAGMGIGVLTEWVAGPYLKAGGVVAKRISRKVLRRPWQLAWRRSLGASGPRLLRALKASEARV